MKRILKIFISPLKFDENIMEEDIGKSKNDSVQLLCHTEYERWERKKETKEREEIIQK